jgi:hypothetical protein
MMTLPAHFCFSQFAISKIELKLINNAYAKSSSKFKRHLPDSCDQQLPVHSLQVEGVMIWNSAGN